MKRQNFHRYLNIYNTWTIPAKQKNLDTVKIFHYMYNNLTISPQLIKTLVKGGQFLHIQFKNEFGAQEKVP